MFQTGCILVDIPYAYNIAVLFYTGPLVVFTYSSNPESEKNMPFGGYSN